MQIQIFRPINAQEITRWLQENPRIEVKGFSVAAGADDPADGHPLSICAILYEPTAADTGVTQVALAEAEQLIDEIVGESDGTPGREVPDATGGTVDPIAPRATGGGSG